ncbi:23S rRNA (uracil(1939)-C(5))-methyltransferase RlmD [Legionella septentrionalis]|uniref:23S rRNA (uracil(1939)-C(5))-methyltransferase RlmD n=1 Tax=Legionella septentrionalis TaxID=2498109 RepID=UPI000F8CBC69|nr:23S rRNA (uracil(1939)-C(5))-methyltransferase RlmD [Legionella septentrionalis]RUR11083.1 23S rRNA (uracil(1939)-C(5))-methyltransferase RlmD [Legionella septentrionalis]RUR15245.1 23S rRNA (uracil(1939)-C(5))-methyltransferase RlmD [Legionella septentrionalis]
MSKRRNQVTKIPVQAVIEKLSHDGRGIARIEGKTTFVQGALSGETVTFEYLRQKKDFDEGKLLSIMERSQDRSEPACSHYDLCGGCSLQHLHEEKQIVEKQMQLADLLSRIGHVEPKYWLLPLTAQAWNYRNKARLSVRFVEKKQATLVGFRERNNPRFITEIHHCPVLNAKVDANISVLRTLLAAFSDPHSIAQVEVAAGDEDVALIFRNLSPLSIDDEVKLQQFAKDTGFKIFLQPGGPESVFLFYPKEAGEFLTYALPEQGIRFKFHPTDFTQVNSSLNQIMVKQALTLLDLCCDDKVLDLFCGLGNFSLPMAKLCHRVVGVEGSQTMVQRASMNAKCNAIDNTEFFCANLEDEEALALLRPYQFNKVLLDPPRTGALTIVQNINKIAPQRIVYISCNPATLARDAGILVKQQGYQMTAAGVMDMFPHTAHVESIALFEKG